MKSLNSFINFRSSRPNLQSSYISLDRWLTVGSPSGLDAKWKLKLVAVLAILLTVGVGNVLGADETLTITGTAVSWGSGSGYKTGSGTLATDASTNIGLSWTDTYNNSGIQMKKSSGLLYSTSYPSTNNKIKSVKITNSTNSATLSCSTDGSSWTTITYTSGTAKDVSSSNYKYFKVVPSGSAYCVLTSIIVVYTTGAPAVAHTVTYNAGTGSCKASEKEASAGAGVTLPTPTHSCYSEGWSFAGWTTGVLVSSETDETPDPLYAGGSTYKPSNDITLYAVYQKGDGLYHLVTTLPTGEDIPGYYMIVNTSAQKAMDAYVVSSYYLDADATGTITSNAINPENVDYFSYNHWKVTYESSKWIFYNESQKKYLYNYNSTYKNLGITGTKPAGYTVSLSGGYAVFASADVSGAYIYYDSSNSRFAGNSTTKNLHLYKLEEATYYSNPTCCTPLGSVNGSINVNNATSVTLQWSAVSGAEKYQVKVPGSSSHDNWTDVNSTSVTVTKSCGTAYTAYFRAIDTDDSHCSVGPESTLAIPAVSWTVSPTISNGTASPAIPGTTCSGFSTTISPETGYALPAEVAVTNADKTWNSSTGELTISNVTGNVTITVTCAAESCSGQYTFDYGGTKQCFSQVDETNEFQITGFTIPTTTTGYWVGYNGAFYNDNLGTGSPKAKSANNQFKYMPVANLQGSSCGGEGEYYKHAAAGAYGTLRIYQNSSADNLYIGFVPAGYFMRYGSGESWSNIQLTQEGSSTVWKSAIMEMDAATIAKNFNIRIFSGASYDANSEGVAINNWTNGGSTISSMQRKTNSGENWASGVTAGMRGFFRTWTDNCANNGYCHFVPVHRIVYHSNWPAGVSPADTYSVDVSIEETNSSIALASAPSAPTGYHFVGWYNAASGGDEVTGTQTISAGTSADVELYAHWSNQTAITLSRGSVGSATPGSAVGTYGSNTVGSFSAVSYSGTSYRLLGYSKSGTPAEIVIDASGNFVANTTYTDASGNWTSTAAEVTLVAQWQAGHTITWMANGTIYETTFVDAGSTLALPDGTPTSCDVGVTDTYTTFIGWYTTPAGTSGSHTASISSCGTKATTSIVPDANQTYYAVWGNGGLSADDVLQGTIDFTDNANWSPALPTDYVTSSDEESYTYISTYTLKFSGVSTKGYKSMGTGSNFIMGQSGAYLKLPAFAFNVSKITSSAATGGSGSVTWNVYDGATAVSTEVTGCAAAKEFAIAAGHQTAGTIYKIQVTNSNNLQIKSLSIYSPGVAATGFISSCCASPAVVTVTPNEDELELNIDGEATTDIDISQTGGDAGRYYPPTVSPAGASVDFTTSYKTAAYTTTFTATAAGTYTVKGNFTETSYGCAKTGSATITVAANPLIQTSVNALTVNGVCDDSGSPQTFTLNSRYLPEGSKTLTITAATTSGSGAYKVSLDGSSYSTSVNVTGGTSAKATQTVYVRYDGAADETGALAGSVTISNGVTSKVVTLSGTCSCGTYVKLTPANETSTHILAPNGQWTRAQGAIAIRANYLSSATENVNIKLTSSNNKFKFTTGTSAGSATFESGKVVTASNNSWDGTVYVVYTPTGYNASESTTITAEVITFGGTTVHATTTTTVYGRSFPETFVLAVNTGSSWVAVPADMVAPYGGSVGVCNTGVGTHDPYPITVDNASEPTVASNVPSRAIYKGASRNTPTSAPWTVQMESYSQTGYYLWGSKTANTIANQNYATGERQKWFAESSDLVTFNFHLDDSIRTAGARLGYSGSAIGQYTSNASSYKYDFRILPVSGDPCNYFIDPVMTLTAYDGTNATVSIPYDGTTNYEISKKAKSTWTDIEGALDCKTLNFTLPLATYRGQDVWLRADGTVCQGDATSVSALHIPAPVITDPGAQHLYGVINVATSESFALTGTDMYGTISVTSSNPAITANYSEGNITVNMASTAVAGDYVTTLTLSSVGAANVTVDVTITIRDLAEMTFSIEDLHNGKICANDLTNDAKFYVALNNNQVVYRAADGSSQVNATSQYSNAVYIRDLSTNGDDWSTGFTYSLTSGFASFAIPTTNLVPGHTYRISYYNSLANSGTGLFNSSRLGFADGYQDFVYSSDCTAPTAMAPCLTSPTSAVANWVYDNCAGTATVSVYTKDETTLMDADCRSGGGITWNAWNKYATPSNYYNKWFRYNSVGDWVAPTSGYGPLLNKASYKAYIYSPQVGQMNGGVTITADTEIEVTVSVYCYNNQKSIQCYVIDGEPTNTSGTLPAGAKACYYNGANTKTDSYTTELGTLNTTVTLNSFRIKGLTSTCRLAFTVGNYASSAGIYVQHVTVKTVTKGTPTNYTPTCSDGTQVMSGLTANTQYYYTVTNGGHTSGEVAFHTWTSGSSYVKFYEDAGHTTEIETLDKIEVLGGQTTHVYMDGQKVPGCEVVPTVSSGYGLEDHTTYNPATGALGGYIDLTLTNPAVTSGTLTITDGTGSTTTREIKSSDCPTDFETLALPATSITKNGATANWNSSADFEGVTEGTLYLYRDGVVDAEYITNEGFETGDLTGWDYFNPGAVCACGAYEVRNSNAHSGTHALYVSEEGSIWAGIKYATVIYGNPVTLPAGTYEMSSWVKVPKVGEFSDKHVSLVQGLVSTGVISRTHAAVYAISENYFDVVSNNTYVKITDEFVIEDPIRALPIIGQRDDYGITFRPFYLDDVSLKRISAPNAEEPDKVFPIADMSAVNSQALGTLSGNTQYSYLLKNENGCPSNTITFKTEPADGPTISAEDIEISAPAGSSATGVIVVQVWDATAEISVSKGVASGSDQITLSNTTVPQEGGTIRVLFTPNTDPGSTGTCPVTLNTRGLAEPVSVNIHWTVTAGEDTDKPIVEVTEVSNEWIKIEHNVEADNVTIILNREKTADEIETNVGDEIFFSKYYEAYSHKKLWAIYNPTSDTISLAGMEVWRSSSKYDGWHSDVMDLSEMGYIKPGWICPNEEIVVYTTNQVGTCEQNTVGLDVMSTWWQGGTSSDMPLSFSGDDALLLVRNTSAVSAARHNALPTTSAKTGEAISWPDPISNARGEWYMLDIIGGRTDGGSPSGKNVQTAWHWYNSKTGEYEDGDDGGWVGYGKDMSGAADYNTSSEHPGYLLSTNRCLLVRLKNVTSGANAINSNIDNMVTLNTEWQGSHVPTAGDQAAVSCANFSFVGGYDYGGYYNTWTEMGDYEIDGEPNPDGSYTAEFAVDKFYCKTVHIEVSSTEIINGVETQNVHAYEDYKVPIVVDVNNQTTAKLFKFGGDTCATCDVVIRDEATLSHVSGGVDQFRNMIVYPGAKFDNSAKQGFLLDGLLMEAKNDEVGYAIINNNGSTIEAGKIVHVKRINDEYWYPFSLPYDCDVAAIRQLNGKTMGEYWEDWGIKYYDGAARQAAGESSAPGASSKFWKQMPVSGTLRANEAYIIGLFTTEWAGQFKSVYFPPKTTKEYSEAGDDAKTTDVYNWAEGLANEPRHHGWNFVGSPYISMFGSSEEGHGLNNSTNLYLGKIEEDGSYSDLGNVYVSIPDGADSKTYTQAKASLTKIEPFKGYFVQTVDPTNGIDNTLNLTYQKTDRTLLSSTPMRKATAQKERVEAELVVESANGGDNAGVVVDDIYTTGYEIGGDLTKMYAAATKPQLYFLGNNNEKMAYIALPDANAENIPMELYAPSSGQYTIRLNKRFSRTNGAESVELLDNGDVVTNLLIDSCTINASNKGVISGYSVRIRRAAQVVTSTDLINGERITVITNNGQMSITNLPGDAKVLIYDMTGRLLDSRTAEGASVVNVDAPQQGVYNVVVQSASGNASIKTIVR